MMEGKNENKLDERSQVGLLLYEIEEKFKTPIKSGVIMNNRINYMRGKDLVKLIMNNLEFIRKRFLEITGTDLGKDKKYFLQNFYENLAKKYKLMFKVIKSSNDTQKSFPKILDQDKDTNKFFVFEDTKYYWINYEKPIKKTNIVLVLFIVVSVVLICVFPLWPLNFKFGVWWFLMGILIFLVSFWVFII